MSALPQIEIDERHAAFNRWLGANYVRLGFDLLPANRQQETRTLMEKAYNAGTNFQRKKGATPCSTSNTTQE